MGGTAFLGYKSHESTLAIVREREALVIQMYQGYLQFGCLRVNKFDLDSKGIAPPKRLGKLGEAIFNAY